MKLFYLALVLPLFACDELSHEDTEVIVEDTDPYITPQASGDVHFAESFDSGNIDVFKSRWVKSSAKKDGADEDIAKYDGEWNVESGVEKSLKGDLGLALKSQAKHHAVSAFLDKPFRFGTDTSNLIVQYDVRFQDGHECGGAYVKLLSDSKELELESFHDQTPYTIMFGPDKCGNDAKLHFIYRYLNPKKQVSEEHHLKFEVPDKVSKMFSDKFSHLLTLILKPDSSFEIQFDQSQIVTGNMLKDFKPALIPEEEINDPEEKKPAEWDDRKRIPDPSASKPEDWDESEPEKIPDPEAVKPEQWLDEEAMYIPDPRAERPSDWDDEMDGEWEAPLIENPKCKPVGCGEWKPSKIPNPKYKGKWSAPSVENPDYQGEWSPKKIPNPDYFTDDNPVQNLLPIRALGLELWSITPNILFDNFVITSDRNVADKWAADTWEKKSARERNAYSDSDSVIDFLYKSTLENPWLWLLYAFVLIIPITCCISFALSRPKKKPSKKSQPKSDAQPSKSSDADDAQTPEPCAVSKDQLEDPEDDDEAEDDHEDGPHATGDTPEECGDRQSSRGDLEAEETPEDDDDQGVDQEGLEEFSEPQPRLRAKTRSRKD